MSTTPSRFDAGSREALISDIAYALWRARGDRVKGIDNARIVARQVVEHLEQSRWTVVREEAVAGPGHFPGK